MRAGKLNLFGWLRRRRRKSPSERLPWYRAPDYSGNLTEAEKRELDAFRMQVRHPAARYGDLPEEVKMYISGLQIEAYDLKQERAAGRAFTFSLAGAALLYINHFGFGTRDLIWPYVVGLALMIVPWIVYRFEWQKNADAFDFGSEGILMEWELDHVTKAKLAAKHASDPPPP